jgi:hypothetical protein
MHPRTKAHAPAPVVVAAAATTPPGWNPPLPSCSEAPNAEAASFPATVLLTPTPWPPKETPPADPPVTNVNPTPASGSAPALTYASYDKATCIAELKKRNVSFTAATATGVDAPVRLNGLLRGIDFRGPEGKAKQATSPWEIADCRLVLALDDFAKILAKHDVVEALHMSMYRPPPKNAKDFKRHDAALAIDLGTLVKKDGTKLVVLNDWHGFIGQKTCGAGTGPSVQSKEATEIRAILCEAAAAQLFNVVLTPNYNKPHANHFHLEVTRGVKWFLVH